jgi:hypothetical protein
MIKIARGLAVSGALLLCAGVALADAPPEGARPGLAPAAPAAEAPEAPRLAPPASQPKRPAAPRITAATPECTWSGRRIVSLLIRDDVDTADKFRRFYDQFGCPTAHVGLALRCVIQSEIPVQAPAQGAVQQGQSQARALAERVEQCWDKPSMKFLNR